MGIQRIDWRLCNGCGICVRICPQDVFRLHRDLRKAVIKYQRDCQNCFLCELECPEKAIFVTPFREKPVAPVW